MRKKLGILLMLIGVAMLFCAGWLLKSNDQEERAAGDSAESVQEQVEAEILKPMPSPGNGGNVMPTVVPEMPTIEIKLPVMSDWSYSQLKIAPCRYWGSVYDDTMVICGHNYRRHFRKIKQLEIGGPVQFIDADGNIYAYQVAALEGLGPYEVERMVATDYDLTLFTCTYGGTAREAVRLRRVLRSQVLNFATLGNST